MSYAGLTRPIRAAQGGEYVTQNPNAVRPVFVQRLRNCTLVNDLWETEPGTRKLNAAAITGAPIIGTVVQFFPQPAVERLIACGRDGTIWKSEDGGASYALLKTGLPINRLLVPVQGGQEETGKPKKLFLLGAGEPQVISGDATTAPGISNPDSLTVILVAMPGAIPPGEHRYVCSFLTAEGETGPSPVAIVTIFNANQAQADLTIPIGPAGVTSRRIYRTAADGTTYKLLATLNDNTTTTYRDNTADGGLTDKAEPVYNATPPVHRISRPHADWATGTQPSAGFILEGRLAVIIGHFVYVSKRDDHEDFRTEGLVFPVFTGRGEEIVNGIYWRQQGWLFKRPRGIYRLDTRELDPLKWQVKEHTEAVGLGGALALVVIEGSDENQFFDDVIFAAPDASWHRLSKTAAYQEGDVNASSISEETYGAFIRENVDLSRMPFCQMVYVDNIMEIQAAFTQKGSAVNNLRIKANLKRLREFGIRFHHSTFPECEALTLKVDTDGNRPIAGTSGGFVKILHQATYQDAGAAYTAEFWTHHDDYGDLGDEYKLSKKKYHFLMAEGVPVGDWNLNIEVYLDEVLQPTVLTVSMKSVSIPPWILDVTAIDDSQLWSGKPILAKKRLRGRAHRISFRSYLTSTNGEYFKISRYQVLFSLSGLSKAR